MKNNYFFSRKGIPNYTVWALTLLPSYVIKVIDSLKETALVYYLISESLFWFLIGVLLTFGIQKGLEKFTNKRPLKIKILYLIVFMFAASIVFNFIFWPIIDVLHEWFFEKKSYHGKFATRIFNWLNWIIWFVSYTAFNLYREVKEAKVKNAELISNLKESQLNTLKGQLNPHFIFNSLNNIRGLILENSEKSRDTLTQLSEMLRYSLTKNDLDAIALNEELEMVENYIDISKIQLEDRLVFKTNIDIKSLDKKIPPMIVQMLVENAIKHGISNLKNGGEIVLSTKVENNYMDIKVVNTGKLQPDKNSTELGLKNIKQRLFLLFGNKAFFNLIEENNMVVATIKIPLYE